MVSVALLSLCVHSALGAPAPEAAAAPPSPVQALPQQTAELHRSMKDHDWDAARAQLAAIAATPGSGPWMEGAAGRAAARLARIGESVDARGLDVDVWVQGEASLPFAGLTVIAWFEPWDAHSKRNIDLVDRLFEDRDPKKLQVVGLTRMTRDTTREALAAFLTSTRTSMPIAIIDETARIGDHDQGLGSQASVIVDDGRVVWAGHITELPEAVRVVSERR